MTHVLIVEDHEENRTLLKMLLEANGYRVTAAGDGLEALAAARRDSPDVVISDVLMPKLDGRTRDAPCCGHLFGPPRDHRHDAGHLREKARRRADPALCRANRKRVHEHGTGGHDPGRNARRLHRRPPAQGGGGLRRHRRRTRLQGLKGEAILLEARILAVADVVEAMSSHRPYRAGLGLEAALAEIERGRGSAYDTAVADACLKLFRERNYAIPA